MKRLHKGFTLVEMLIAIMLMASVGIIVGIIFNTMFSSHDLLDRELSLQAEMRTAMQATSRTIENSTATFILDDSKYNGRKDSLTKEWSYIGLSEDGKRILDYRWNKEKKDWDVKEFGIKSLYDLKLDLVFKTEGTYQDNRLIKYELTGTYPQKNNKLSIDTASIALNSKQVFSKVAKGKKGVALAYRNDPIEGQMKTAISFIFDTSGSMQGTLDGYLPYGNNQSRMDILKEKAKQMMDELKTIGNVNVNLVKFSTVGEYIQEEYTNLDNGTTQIYRSIDAMQPDAVTNPGDGLRYGLVSLQKNSAQLKYAVLLTDGLPNAFTVANRIGSNYRNWPFELSDKVGPNSNRDVFSGGKSLDRAVDYPGDVAKKFASGVRRVNVIGFSALKQDTELGRQLTANIGKSGVEAKYDDATSKEALEKVFSDIRKQIKQDLWFVSGP